MDGARTVLLETVLGRQPVPWICALRQTAPSGMGGPVAKLRETAASTKPVPDPDSRHRK